LDEEEALDITGVVGCLRDSLDRDKVTAIGKRARNIRAIAKSLPPFSTRPRGIRLFLKLAAQLEPGQEIEPLPDIDFNIRAAIRWSATPRAKKCAAA
jgi:hypothetical protein